MIKKIKIEKSAWAWSFYDWANSAFATTVMAGFFPIFFKEFWSYGSNPIASSLRLGIGSSLAGIIIALIAPILGSFADVGRNRKWFLVIFALLGAAFTGLLYLVPQGAWYLAMIFYIIAGVGFFGSNIFYDALLPHTTSEENYHLVSSIGYSLGYLGGGILFAFNVATVLQPDFFHITSSAEAVKLSFVSVALWWLLFTVPLLVFVKEKENGRANKSIDSILKNGWKQYINTYRDIKKYKNLALFLLAYWFYIDGVDTIVRMAVDYGLSLGFNKNDLIVALIITQFTGFPAALLYVYFAHKMGIKRSLLFGILIYLLICIWAAFIKEKIDFYLIAFSIGCVQGGVQALSRSIYSLLIPADQSAEFFGFYNMFGKFAVIIGPLLMSSTSYIILGITDSENIAIRSGIVSIGLLFIAGSYLLTKVKFEE